MTMQPIYVVTDINGKYLAAFTSFELALKSLQLSYSRMGEIKKGHKRNVYVSPDNQVFKILNTILYNTEEHI